MAEAIFHAPRKKRRVFESFDSPFPISSSLEDIWGKDFRICQAEVINNNVIVRNPEDMEQLYSKGYFGKGVLSRSRPEYNISDPLLVAKWQDARINLPIVSSKKYQCHLEWAKCLMQEQGFDGCSVNKTLENYIKPFDLPFMKGKEVAQNDSHCKMTAEMENADNGMKLPRGSAINDGDLVAPKVECHNKSLDCKKACLGSDSAYDDPLAKHDSEELCSPDGKDTVKVHFQKHDDFTVHCGSKVEDCRSHVFPDLAKGKEDAYEYVLVQEEEESKLCREDKAVNDESNQLVKREKLVCRRNPFRIFEYLQLSLEEAFFLVYALGCLSIYYNEEPLTILKLWEIFSEVQPNFRTTYMAYHYFRSKGWVPKVGLKYGTDLLLYRKGPPFYHASYSVIAELVNDNFEGSPHRPLNWMSLSGLNRTTINVSKELILCYLIKSCDMTEKEMLSPECLKRIKVQELIINRWVSSRERSEQDEL